MQLGNTFYWDLLVLLMIGFSFQLSLRMVPLLTCRLSRASFHCHPLECFSPVLLSGCHVVLVSHCLSFFPSHRMCMTSQVFWGNSCRLVVFCHWTCPETRHRNCDAGFDFRRNVLKKRKENLAVQSAEHYHLQSYDSLATFLLKTSPF